MKVGCPGCSAKYSLSDQKVRGKRARFTCKRCGATVLVDGLSLDSPAPNEVAPNEVSAAPARAAAAPANALLSEAVQASTSPSEEEVVWILATSEEQRESVSPARLAELIESGAVADETYAWRAGMDAWTTIRELREQSGPRSPAELSRVEIEAPSMVSNEVPAPSAVSHLPVRRAPLSAASYGAANGGSAGDSSMEARPSRAPLPARAPLPPSARRATETRLAPASPVPHLLDDGAARALGHPVASIPGLVGEPLPSFAAFQSPPSAEPDPVHHRSNAPFALDVRAPEKKEGRPALYMAGILAASLAVALGLGIPQKLLGTAEPSITKLEPSADSLAATAATELDQGLKPSSDPLGSDTETSQESEAPAPPEEPTTQDAPPVEAKPSVTSAAAARPERTEQREQPNSTSLKPDHPSEPQETEEPTSANAATDKQPAPQVSEANLGTDAALTPGSGDSHDPLAPLSSPTGTSAVAESPESAVVAAPPFDKSAAGEAMRTTAENLQGCVVTGGPSSGSGVATVTFAPSGRVTTASVTGDFAGSSVGGCIARKFRATRVPAFSGEAITVSKRFSIE